MIKWLEAWFEARRRWPDAQLKVYVPKRPDRDPWFIDVWPSQGRSIMLEIRRGEPPIET